MRIFLMLFLLIMANSLSAKNSDISRARELYQHASFSKDSARALHQLLDQRDFSNDPVLRGYQGASQAIWAEYVFNPMEKLRLFKMGKTLLEDAIRRAPNAWELRYIRFTVQCGTPAFLNYGSNIAGDKEFVIDHFKQDPRKGEEFITRKAAEYFLQSKQVTPSEKARIKSLIVFN